jgi:AcrR family transcriptional regulator
MSDELLDAALSLIRTKGYASTTVDDICDQAGLTKGAFFHHFKNKEALGIAAADYWSEMTGAFFAGAPYHKHKDPLDRVLGYIDLRKAILTGKVPEFTCLVFGRAVWNGLGGRLWPISESAVANWFFRLSDHFRQAWTNCRRCRSVWQARSRRRAAMPGLPWPGRAGWRPTSMIGPAAALCGWPPVSGV